MEIHLVTYLYSILHATVCFWSEIFFIDHWDMTTVSTILLVVWTKEPGYPLQCTVTVHSKVWGTKGSCLHYGVSIFGGVHY